MAKVEHNGVLGSWQVRAKPFVGHTNSAPR
jgi:hypothetical protein